MVRRRRSKVVTHGRPTSLEITAMTTKYRFQWYQRIHENTPKIHEDAREAARELGLEKWRDRVGLYSGASSCPGPLPGYVLDAIVAANTGPLLPLRRVEDELRVVVKDLFGDEYDGAAANTCEAALRVSFETLSHPRPCARDNVLDGLVSIDLFVSRSIKVRSSQYV